MIKPSNIVSALTALLRKIDDLVEAMGGDESRIVAYDDIYPQNVNLPHAIHEMPSPSILVVYQDWGVGADENGQPINHRLTIYIRPAADSSYSDLTSMFINGIPADQPLQLINITVLDDLDPMQIEGRCSRQLDEEGVEYWELNITFNEKWG